MVNKLLPRERMYGRGGMGEGGMSSSLHVHDLSSQLMIRLKRKANAHNKTTHPCKKNKHTQKTRNEILCNGYTQFYRHV